MSDPITSPHRQRLDAALHEDTADILRGLTRDNGQVATTLLGLATNPTAGDTITIGGDTYEFNAAAASLADDDYRAVLIGADAGETRDNLIAAINGTAASEHASIFQTDGTTAAWGVGRLPLFAEEEGTGVRITTADDRGGQRAARTLDAAVSSSLTDGSDGWELDGENLNDLGRDPAHRKSALVELTVTADMITLGTLRLDLPFQPTAWIAQVRTSGGVIRAPSADALAASADGLTLTLNGGGAPDIQATDIVVIQAWE